jgi:hypothetical protein
VTHRDDGVDKQIKQALPWLESFRIVAFTDDQDLSLRYAISHISDLARSLHRDYYDKLEGGP